MGRRGDLCMMSLAVLLADSSFQGSGSIWRGPLNGVGVLLDGDLKKR